MRKTARELIAAAILLLTLAALPVALWVAMTLPGALIRLFYSYPP